MVNKKYDLIICEKEQQAEDIANALNVPELTEQITIPSKETLAIEYKIRSKEARIYSKNEQIKKFEATYKKQGKKFSHLKGYKSLIEQRDKWATELGQLEKQYTILEPLLKTKTLTYWKGESKVILSCLGHLISIKLTERIDGLNFKTKLDFPSPTNQNETNKWLQLKLIEKYLDKNKINKIICATDFDREGDSIFGTIMEYYDFDVSKCLRMKFSTLESQVLREAYNNLLTFDINMFNSGKMRRWMDYIIGFNLNPIFAKIYRATIEKYLEDLKLDEKFIKNIKYDNTFNIGRVKLVIMDYIYNYTKKQIKISSEIENKEAKIEEKELYNFYFYDHDNIQRLLYKDEIDEIKQKMTELDLNKPISLKIKKIDYKEKNKMIPSYSEDDVPSFLNLTKVFQLCSELGASTEEINRVLEFLYLQTFISYPRSKSEKWEIPIEADKLKYAHSVLDTLKTCGYPIKKYYYDSYGKEGDKTHSHPCIHPLSSITLDKIKKLKKINPLAFLVFNEIVIYTLKCFEKLPLIRRQKIEYELHQDNNIYSITDKYNIELLEENLLTYEGFSYRTEIEKEVNVKVNDEFIIDLKKNIIIDCEVEKNREKPKMLNDFDIVNFLNENDIGTDATRTVILNSLIDLKYFVSNNILLSTFLGNTLSILADKYVSFIDVDYTLDIEKKLNKIEQGKLTTKEFKGDIKKLIKETYNIIQLNTEEIKKLFLDLPKCEEHNISMIIKQGRYGKFLQCPYFYTKEKCNQKFSI